MAAKEAYVNIGLELVNQDKLIREQDIRISSHASTRKILRQITEDLELDRNRVEVNDIKFKYKNVYLTDSELLDEYLLTDGDVIEVYVASL